MNITLLIPSYNPTVDIIELIKDLLNKTNNNVLIINDGSSKETLSIFDELSKMDRVHVLHHETNSGKGKAIKTGLTYLNTCKENEGVITLDDDGQHLIKDVLKLEQALIQEPSKFILGSRKFDLNTPKRSLLGNTISSYTMSLLHNINLRDTQTGLRAFSKEQYQWMIDTNGDKYEYETNILINSKFNNIQLVEVYITTVYLNNNENSKFHSLKDGFKVYFSMFKVVQNYILIALSSFLIDIIIFILMYNLLKISFNVLSTVALSTLIARLISSTYNFLLNQYLFMRKLIEFSFKRVIKYILLWIIIISLSITFVDIFIQIFNIEYALSKVIVDLSLAIISYYVQMRFIFID